MESTQPTSIAQEDRARKLQSRRPPAGPSSPGRKPKRGPRAPCRRSSQSRPTQSQSSNHNSAVNTHLEHYGTRAPGRPGQTETCTLITKFKSAGRRKTRTLPATNRHETPLKRRQTSSFSIDEAHSSADLAAPPTQGRSPTSPGSPVNFKAYGGCSVESHESGLARIFPKFLHSTMLGLPVQFPRQRPIFLPASYGLAPLARSAHPFPLFTCCSPF